MAATALSTGPERWRDEIALREASLADATRERARGELSAEGFAQIETRERAALERARAALATVVDVPQVRRARRRRGRWLVVAFTAFALAAAVLLWASISPRQAGNSITGSVTLNSTQKVTALLGEAEADVANGDVVAALSAYQQVLALRANNVVALTQSGWLDFSAGSADHKLALVSLGERTLERALALAPRNPATRLYYAIVAASTPGEGALAKREFTIFLTLHPSVGQLAVAQPFLEQLKLATP